MIRWSIGEQQEPSTNGVTVNKHLPAPLVSEDWPLGRHGRLCCCCFMKDSLGVMLLCILRWLVITHLSLKPQPQASRAKETLVAPVPHTVKHFHLSVHACLGHEWSLSGRECLTGVMRARQVLGADMAVAHRCKLLPVPWLLFACLRLFSRV